jgi:hypothetical protein
MQNFTLSADFKFTLPTWPPWAPASRTCKDDMIPSHELWPIRASVTTSAEKDESSNFNKDPVRNVNCTSIACFKFCLCFQT